MGIRFNCPQGHKLNVKSFLAGKKGICPHCNCKVDIPLKSTRSSSKEERATGRAARSVPLGAPTASVAAPSSGGGQGVATQTAAMPGAAPLAKPVSAPTSNAPMARPLSAAPGITPGTPAATVLPTKGPNSVPFPGGSGLQPGSAPAGGFTAAPAHTALPKAGAPAAAASPAAALDPIAQAPHAVWYVRPNSGGQFGPASGDVLRQWIDQGRVAAESLVWRDGWPGWQQAAAVFPQLARGSTPPDAAPPLTAPSGAMLSLDLPASPSSAPRGAAARRAPGQKSNQMTIVIVAALALVVLGLGGVLFWVMAFR